MSVAAASSPSLADSFRRRPFASIAIFLILGLFFHRVLPFHPGTYLLLSTALLACSLPRRAAAIANLLLSLALFLCGAGLAQIEAFGFASSHIAHFTADSPRLAQLELRLTSPPRLLQGQPRGGRLLPARQVAEARVTHVLTNSGWQEATGQILIQIAHPDSRLSVNNQLRALGMLHRPFPAANPGRFVAL